jgi:hypothetical protein
LFPQSGGRAGKLNPINAMHLSPLCADFRLQSIPFPASNAWFFQRETQFSKTTPQEVSKGGRKSPFVSSIGRVGGKKIR